MKGFTLIELLIVIGITVVLSTVGILNLFNHQAQKDLDMTVNEIISTLRVAQNYSVSQELIESGSGRKWGVHFESGNYALFRGIDYNDLGKTIVSKSVLRATVEFKTLPSPQDIIFNLITGKPGSSSTIEVSLKNNPNNFKTIMINGNGRIE